MRNYLGRTTGSALAFDLAFSSASNVIKYHAEEINRPHDKNIEKQREFRHQHRFYGNWVISGESMKSGSKDSFGKESEHR